MELHPIHPSRLTRAQNPLTTYPKYERGEFTRHEGQTYSWIEFDPNGRWEDAQAVRLAAAQPLPGFGVTTQLDEDVRRWPAHWLLSNGLTAEARSPRGATTTVSELLPAAAEGAPIIGEKFEFDVSVKPVRAAEVTAIRPLD